MSKGKGGPAHDPAHDLEVAVGAIEWIRTCPLVDRATDESLQRVSVWLGKKAHDMRKGKGG